MIASFGVNQFRKAPYIFGFYGNQRDRDCMLNPESENEAHEHNSLLVKTRSILRQ